MGTHVGRLNFFDVGNGLVEIDRDVNPHLIVEHFLFETEVNVVICGIHCLIAARIDDSH